MLKLKKKEKDKNIEPQEKTWCHITSGYIPIMATSLQLLLSSVPKVGVAGLTVSKK